MKNNTHLCVVCYGATELDKQVCSADCQEALDLLGKDVTNNPDRFLD